MIISLYGVILSAHFIASLADAPRLPGRLAGAGVPLAVLSAIYTAWLFAQAKARDLWQSPLLPPQLLVQAVMAGAAALVLVAGSIEPDHAAMLARIAAGATLVHLLLVAGEVTMTHGTAHARLAAWEMTSGRHALFFGTGIALQALGVVALWVAPGPPGAVLVLAGLLAYEHAYVQAGQAVPLA